MSLTNLADSQYEIIKEFVEDNRKRKYSLKTIINAVLYLCRTGTQWRMLPKDFPEWQLVYFHKWNRKGIWKKIQEHLRKCVRKKKGQEESPRFSICKEQRVWYPG